MDLSVWWRINEYYSFILFFGVTVMPFVFVQIRRYNSTGNCMNCCSCMKQRLKHENQHIEVPIQTIFDRNNMTLISSLRSAQCSDENERDPSLQQLTRSNSRTSSNSSIASLSIRVHVNPFAEHNEPFEIQSKVLQANSQSASTSDQQAFSSRNSISLENKEISQYSTRTDMDALSLGSAQDSNISEDSNSQIVAFKAIQSRHIKENHDNPDVINSCSDKADLDMNGLSDQDIADLKGLSTETASNPIDGHCSIDIERSNTDENHSNLNQSNLRSLSLNSINHTVENGVTACNHIDQDTTARRSSQQNIEAASQRQIDHTEQSSLKLSHYSCKHIKSDSINRVCSNSKDSTDFNFQLNCSANDVAQASKMNKEQQTSSHSEYEIPCVVDHDDNLCNEAFQTVEVNLNIVHASPLVVEPSGFADTLGDDSTKSGRDSGYESRRPSFSSNYQQLEVIIDSDSSSDLKSDLTALSHRQKHYSGSSLRLFRQQQNACLASACYQPSASFNSGCQQIQPGQSGQDSESFSKDFRMEHHEQVYNYNIGETSSVDEFEGNSISDSLNPDLHHDSYMLLIENEEKLLMDEADWRNHQLTTDLLPHTNNTDRKSVLQAVGCRNDLVPDSPEAAENKTHHLPDILVTTVDGRQDPIAFTSLPSLTIDDTHQSFGGYYFSSSHSLVSQVTEDAEGYNLPAAHFASGFTELEFGRISTQRPRLESESSTATGSSTAMLASSAVTAGQLVRALVVHLTTGLSSTNLFCEIQHIMPRLLQATVSDNQDSRFLENLLRGTSLTIDLLTAACYGGFQGTVERLILDNPLLINQQDSTGATPLAAASAAGNLDTVRWLLRNEADVNIPTSNGRTSLIVACEQLQHNVFWYLTGEAEVDVDVDAVDDDSNTALHYVIEKSSNGGRSQLHNVCIDSDAGYVRKIVFASSRNEVNAQDNDGWTPLHLACLMGKQDVVNILMWAGADTDVLDTDGNTPGDLAVLLGHYDIAVTLGHRPYPEDVWFPTDFPFFMNLLDD